MNFIFISPAFPQNYYNFCDRLKRNGFNVLGIGDTPYFELENDFWCCMRPSGTEPKIKFYMGVVGSNLEEAEILVKDLSDSMKGLME